MTIRYVGPGDLVGAMVVEPSDISTNIQALEPSVLLHLDPFRVRSLAAQQPTLALALVDELTHRLRQAYRALAAGTFTSVSSRVARDLVERARARNPRRLQDPVPPRAPHPARPRLRCHRAARCRRYA